jgi:hypothetical protein
MEGSAMNYRSCEKIDIQSKTLGRETFCNVWVPDAPAGAPLLVYLHGCGAKPENDDLVRAAGVLSQGGFPSPILAMPWGFDGLESSEWVDRYDGSLSLETHIMDELLPELDHRYRAGSGKMICGCSMGGYGAINLALHHQDVFCSCAAWSPAGLRNPMKHPDKDEKLPEELNKHDPRYASFNPYEMDLRVWGPLPQSKKHRIRNSPWHYIDEIGEIKIGISFDCGDRGFPEEMLLPSILAFHGKLLEKHVPHAFEQIKGGHCENNSIEAISEKLLFMYGRLGR